MRARMHARVRLCTRTCVRIYMYACAACARVIMDTHVCVCVLTRARACTCTCSRACARVSYTMQSKSPRHPARSQYRRIRSTRASLLPPPPPSLSSFPPPATHLRRHAQVHLQPLGGRLELGAPAVAVRLVETAVALVAPLVPLERVGGRRGDLPVLDVSRDHPQRTVLGAVCRGQRYSHRWYPDI